MKVSCKSKLIIARVLYCILLPLFIFVILAIYVAFGGYEIVESVPEIGIKDFWQWFTIVSFRLIIYLVPSILIAFWKFDKRFKYHSRFLIWLNFHLCILTIISIVYKFLAFEMIFNRNIFSSLDSFSTLGGYILTFIFKKKIQFDSTGAIIDKYSYKM